MFYSKKSYWLALLSGALMATGASLAQDSNKALLDLLVKKGVLTSQDAMTLEKEVRSSAASAQPASTATPVAASKDGKPPLFFKIGAAEFTPFGFLDFTSVYRNVLNGGDIGSSFGSIPYSNTANSKLSETRFSAKNSRLGLRVDSTFEDMKVLGYVEADFLGNQPTNINVASNSDTMRMRVYFADLRKGDWEFLAGQDWSMMTPNRKGISPIPGDIFFTQNVDANYQVGLVWGRTPQIRAVYHATDEFTFGFSAENPDQYTGSAVVFPTGFNTAQVDNGSNGTATPNVMPDLIGKVAFDTKLGNLPFHADAAALYRSFKINSFSAGTLNSNATADGYGASFNSNLTIIPGLQLIENAFWSKGGARYLSTGLGPDLVVNAADANGAFSISTVQSYAGMLGAEWDVTPMDKFYGYYGFTAFKAKYSQMSNGNYVGYGFPGSANSNNRRVEEFTIGNAYTFWKNPSYGDLKLLAQLSYLQRKPFVVAPGTPSSANMTMFYLDIRYDLP
ncbi:MAG TPA: hypothetical protein VKC60_04630 [Opitutaceae bacterium]|nr:hypothetical protein [Opitutaceae bacterium]